MHLEEELTSLGQCALCNKELSLDEYLDSLTGGKELCTRCKAIKAVTKGIRKADNMVKLVSEKTQRRNKGAFCDMCGAEAGRTFPLTSNDVRFKDEFGNEGERVAWFCDDCLDRLYMGPSD